MSLSRIIKFQPDANAESMPSFNFRPIGQAVNNQGGGGFVPLSLFDTSELAGTAALAQKGAPDPDSVVLTEDELNRRLQEAFGNGLAEGKNLAERGLFNVFKALRVASEGIHTLRDKVLRESEDELLKLVMMVARKVILREIAQDRGILSDVIQNAIAGLSERDEITVRINPDDYALATTGRDEILRKELASERMTLKPDPSVLSGFCLIDANMGTINASIEAQLDEIYRRLLVERCTSPDGGA